MKRLRKFLGACALFVGLAGGQSAHAGIPVIDGAHIAESIMEQVETIAQWAEQYGQMVETISQLEQQYNQAVTTYNSIQGIRNMGSLVNNPLLRKYMPAEYQTVLRDGYNGYQAIENAARVFDISGTSLQSGTAAFKAFKTISKQASSNRALYEDAYAKASNRFDDLQVLLDKVNNAPDDKDVQDLQARIAAESTILQNEQLKLNMAAKLADAQREMQMQAAAERRIAATRGTQTVDW